MFQGTARWWKLRTGLERVLLPLTVLLILLCFVLLLVILPLDRRRGQLPSLFRSNSFSETDALQSLVTPAATTLIPLLISSIPSSTTTVLPLKKEPEICTTPGCVKAANNLVSLPLLVPGHPEYSAECHEPVCRSVQRLL